MDDAERELILRAVETDEQLRRLYDEHIRLERLLVEYGNRVYLSAEEEMEEKELKRRKLRGKDLMMQLVADFASEQSYSSAG